MQENTPPKKKSDLILYVVIFIIVLFFIFGLPNISSLFNGNGWNKNAGEDNTGKPDDNKNQQDITVNQKTAAWFQTYVGPLYRAGFFGNYISNTPNAGTKTISNDTLLDFAFVNTVGIDKNIMSGKYKTAQITDEAYTDSPDHTRNVALVPEKEVTALIKKYFGVNFTYKPTKPKSNITSYYDSDNKAYARIILSFIGSSEQYAITGVSYKNNNVTLSYKTTINGKMCSSDYPDQDIITGTGTLKLYYNGSNYIYKTNTYTANSNYAKCWQQS